MKSLFKNKIHRIFLRSSARRFSSSNPEQSSPLDQEQVQGFTPDLYRSSKARVELPQFADNKVSINFPWLINGTPSLPIQTRFMGEQIFSRLKAHKNEVLEHLYKIFRAVLMAGADGDYQFLKEYCEDTFYDAYIKRLEDLKKAKIQLIVEEDKRADSGRPMQVIANIYDHTVIKGLSIKRDENGQETEYSILNDIEDLGFISYIPKYIQDPRNFVNPQKNKVIHSEAHKIVFRAYVEIKSGLQIFLKDENYLDLFEYPSTYSWRHVAVFESPMKPPPQTNVWKEQESLMEWIAKHTFGPWYLVDLDNWLAGNPLVIPKFKPMRNENF